MPDVRGRAPRGDLYVTLIVRTPVRLSSEARDLLRQFDAVSDRSLADLDETADAAEEEAAGAAGAAGGKKKKKKRFTDRIKDVLQD